MEVSFFGFDSKGNHIPLGLTIVDGVQKFPKHPWSSGGVIAATRQDTSILPIKGFAPSPEILHALQSKPLLIEGGRNGIRSDDEAWFDRAASGFPRKGRPSSPEHSYRMVARSPSRNLRICC